jgi:cell division protein FtsB
VHFLLVFATIVLVVDALVGEKGFLETLKVRRQHRELQASVELVRQDNARLRDKVRRLNDDPAEIELVAREELGLIKPGEMLFIVRDARPAPTSR